jgi:hypothetical protein
MDDINVFFIFIQIDISCNYKLHLHFAIARHFLIIYVTTNYFYQVVWKIVKSKVTKMVHFGKSCKCMGWNGHDSL